MGKAEERQRERGSEGEGEKVGAGERERESLLPNQKMEEWKKIVGQGSQKHEEKNKTYFDTLVFFFFFYISTSLPWLVMSPILGGWGLLGTSSQTAVLSFHLDSANSE